MGGVPCPLCDSTAATFERSINGHALVRCDSCAFVFVSPRPSGDEIDAIYTDRDADALIQVYERIGSAPSVRRDYAERLGLLERELPGRGRLLDFACGAGHFFELAQQRGWDAHGSELGLWAKAAAERRGLSNMHIGSIASIGFPDGHFDVVHAAQVFEHLGDPIAQLREVRRILKPGGLFYIDVPNYRTLSIVLGRDDFMLNEPPQHINYFAPATLERLLRIGNFEGIRITSGGGVKWENLVGRSIRSERKDAYGLGDGVPSTTRTAGQTPPGRRVASGLKRLVKAGFVRPVLYEWFKCGMALIGICRKPRLEPQHA